MNWRRKSERSWGQSGMKSEWKSEKIGNVVDIRRGASPRPIHKFLTNTGMPWVKIADATSDFSRYLRKTNEYIIDEGIAKSVVVDPGTLIVSNSATPGLPKIMKIEACVHDGWLVFANYKGITRDFLYYKFIDIRQRLVNQANGSVFKNLKTDIVKDFDISVPSILTQNKIVGILSKLDEKIELNNAINNNLEQQVSARYKSLFENFDLTNGVCPKNWGYKELSTIADIMTGKRPPIKSEVCNQNTPFPIVGASSIMGFTSKANHIDRILVIGRVGTHGVIQRFNTPCWASDNTLVITSQYYEFTNQILHRIDYPSMNRGSTQPLITQGDMKKVVVLVPEKETLIKFEKFANSLMKKWAANNIENDKLSSLRDTILPKLMSGELDVSIIDL